MMTGRGMVTLCIDRHAAGGLLEALERAQDIFEEQLFDNHGPSIDDDDPAEFNLLTDGLIRFEELREQLLSQMPEETR